MTINLIEDKASIPSVYKKGYIGFGYTALLKYDIKITD